MNIGFAIAITNRKDMGIPNVGQMRLQVSCELSYCGQKLLVIKSILYQQKLFLKDAGICTMIYTVSEHYGYYNSDCVDFFPQTALDII